MGHTHCCKNNDVVRFEENGAKDGRKFCLKVYHEVMLFFCSSSAILMDV
jgi:hypothetical protein